jgi:hypothetical protein
MAETGADRMDVRAEDVLFADVEQRRRKKNAVLFSRDSACLRDLIGLIERQRHRTLVLWALDCARVPLARFEGKYSRESRPRTALEKCEAWSKGKIKMPIAKRAILDAHAAAKEIDDREYGAMCHAIGHAGATVHVETHALGLPFYELTALVLEYEKGGYQGKVRDKIDYYCQRLTHWQENIDRLDFGWADFLTDDSRPNKEKLLSEKRGCNRNGN